ncbi:hypothetical protein BTRA_636 [Burkholderia thailandensis USAMRU Malaysia |nr:hypothetical protein BTRA_636 [Burkholderia thailandensis USAMRU Malaysia \
MALNLANAHAARIHADHVVVEAWQPALVLANQLRLKRRLSIAQNIQLQFAVGRQDRLGAGAVAVVTGPALLGLGCQMVAQLGREHALGQLLLELAGQPRFAQDRLGILALNLGKQLIDQLIGKQLWCLRILALLAHCCIGHRTLVPLSSHDLSTLKI